MTNNIIDIKEKLLDKKIQEQNPLEYELMSKLFKTITDIQINCETIASNDYVYNTLGFAIETLVKIFDNKFENNT